MIVSFVADFNLCGHVSCKGWHELRIVRFLILHGIRVSYLCMHTHVVGHSAMTMESLLLKFHHCISANSLSSSCRTVAKEVANPQKMKSQWELIGDFHENLLAPMTGHVL